MFKGSVLLDPPEIELLDGSAEPQVRTYCIVGLGNPGASYQDTPHNIGFKVIDGLAKRHLVRFSKHQGPAATGTGKFRNKDVVLVKPQTFMNNSGAGVSAILKSR